MIAHLLSQFPYEEIERSPVKLPERMHSPDYERKDLPDEMYVPEAY